MDISEFDYYLPPELIAQYPAPHREDSRLLVLDKVNGAVSHHRFPEVIDFLHEGDLLVLNDTKVFPARLYGKRSDTGGRLEVMLLDEKEPGVWETLVRPGRRAHTGQEILFGGGKLKGVIGERTPDGGRLVSFPEVDQHLLWQLIFELGEVPLPPYIKRPAGELDKERYQTVYAREVGSVAAPTAGLHFTKELLEQVRRRGVKIAYVLLHVGLGTFRPVREQKIEEHQMHSEFWRLTEETARQINETRERGGRVIPVGTTSVRVLETAAVADGKVAAGEGWTRLFIYPGFHFRIVDGLITNFHLPCSTLLMLISALAGKEHVLNAYQEAVRLRYRFFSYGDAMLII